MRLAFRIALRFLTANKGQTIMIALGIAVGISVQIFIGSLIQGLQISLLDTTIGRSSHITISADKKNAALEDYKQIETLLLQNYPEVKALSPTVSIGGFLKIKDTTEQVFIRGFDLKRANDIYKFDKSLISGKLDLASDEVLIGSELAKENSILIGDVIQIITSEQKVFQLKVAGILDLKVAALNKTWVVGSLELVQKIFDYQPNQISSIEMQLSEPFSADLISEKMLNEATGFAIKIDNWKVQNEQLLSGLKGQSSSSLIIQVFVVISVVLGIASVLAISVLQKSKQLGILKAMGINDGVASLVFLFQGFILGILGGLLGIGMGLGLLWSFSKFALNSNGTPVVPIFINYAFIGMSGLIAVSASTFAAIIPALKSRKLSPIEVIKNG
jgi:lipoprotein-releasing system permease protein